MPQRFDLNHEVSVEECIMKAMEGLDELGRLETALEVGGRDGVGSGRVIARGCGGDVEDDLGRGMVESAAWVIDGVYDRMRDV